MDKKYWYELLCLSLVLDLFGRRFSFFATTIVSHAPWTTAPGPPLLGSLLLRLLAPVAVKLILYAYIAHSPVTRQYIYCEDSWMTQVDN